VVRVFLPLLLFGLVLGACTFDDDQPATAWPSRDLRVVGGGASVKLRVELATTERQREQGLMFRQSLKEDQGMLFLFPADGSIGFWMENTYVPLTIAYLAVDGTVLELRDGTPLDRTELSPKQPYRHVLEVNQGWFERHRLGVGSKVELPGDLPAPQ
jgi:hypothetical protein